MRISYIVACWFGERRAQTAEYKEDKLFYIKTQLEKFKHLNTDIEELIFVINNTGETEYVKICDQACKLIRSFKKIKTRIILRENKDFSYGAWDHALQLTANDFDYSFLIEDDYVPVVDYFEKKFISFFDNGQEIVFVASAWQEAFSPGVSGSDDEVMDYMVASSAAKDAIRGVFKNLKYHASVSNGVIKNSIYSTVFASQKKGFELHDNEGWTNSLPDYVIAEINQTNFLDTYTNAGFKVVDVRNLYNTEYLDCSIDGVEIVKYGNQASETLLCPII